MSLPRAIARRSLWLVLAAAVVGPGCSNSGTTPPANTPAPPGGGNAGYRVFSSFKAAKLDAEAPDGTMAVVDGRIYGIAHGGLTFSSGVIFDGSDLSRPFVVHRFGSGDDGAEPNKDLIVVGGVIYGTTKGGGKFGKGTVFSYDPSKGAVNVLYNFTGGSDGATPAAGVTYLLSRGLLFGTTTRAGRFGKGTLFALTTTGSNFTVYRSFGPAPDVSQIEAPLVVGGGVLWGVATEGGSHKDASHPNGDGAIFWTTGAKAGTWFNCDGDTMLAPHEALAYDNALTLYGVASGIGKPDGYIYAVPIAKPQGTPSIVYSFNRSQASKPSGALYIDPPKGRVFGVTELGPNGQPGGTFYEFNYADRKFDVRHAFTGNGSQPSDDGDDPASQPVFFSDALFGTTRGGGADGIGTIWADNQL